MYVSRVCNSFKLTHYRSMRTNLAVNNRLLIEGKRCCCIGCELDKGVER